LDRFWNHPDFSTIYKAHLCQTYSIIRATVPLLRTAAKGLRDGPGAGTDRTNALVDYLERHADEETGHDQWTLQDAQAIGISRDEIVNAEPSLPAIHLVGAQYYWLHHKNPLAILGYIAVMEGSPATPAFFEDVARRNGLPLEAVNSFVVHSKIDPGHKADLDAAIDRYQPTRSEIATIGLSALRSVYYLTRVMREINEVGVNVRSD
jgi:pyrroloquinoline quinone (PQQ) biosynthesis protein C